MSAIDLYAAYVQERRGQALMRGTEGQAAGQVIRLRASGCHERFGCHPTAPERRKPPPMPHKRLKLGGFRESSQPCRSAPVRSSRTSILSV